MLLNEFKMIGLANPEVAMMGRSSHQGHGHDAPMVVDHGGHKGSISMEDCCKAVLCLIECCDCEITKQKIRQCCEDILSSC